MNIREVPLGGGLVAIVDAADYDRVVAAGPWHSARSARTTYAKHSYSRAEGKFGKAIKLHQFVTGATQVDHINGNGVDNRRSNLRAATSKQNAGNRPVRRDSRNPYKGVEPAESATNPWRARLRKRHLGVFPTPEDAARAYDTAARAEWGEFANTNFKEQP